MVESPNQIVKHKPQHCKSCGKDISSSSFKKKIYEIDSIHIDNNPIKIGGFPYNYEYLKTYSVFAWETVSYEDRIFQGKGFFEIIDTLFAYYQDVCCLPRKIEFE